MADNEEALKRKKIQAVLAKMRQQGSPGLPDGSPLELQNPQQEPNNGMPQMPGAQNPQMGEAMQGEQDTENEDTQDGDPLIDADRALTDDEEKKQKMLKQHLMDLFTGKKQKSPVMGMKNR